MSLTLGLIVWFYEKRKKTRKPSGEKGKRSKKNTTMGEKKGWKNRQASGGKNRFHSILLCAIENLQIAFCFHCRLKQAASMWVGGSEPAAFELLAGLSCVQFSFLFLLADWLGPLTKWKVESGRRRYTHVVAKIYDFFQWTNAHGAKSHCVRCVGVLNSNTKSDKNTL